MESSAAASRPAPSATAAAPEPTVPAPAARRVPPRAYRIYFVKGRAPLLVTRYVEKNGRIHFQRRGAWASVPKREIRRIVPVPPARDTTPPARAASARRGQAAAPDATPSPGALPPSPPAEGDAAAASAPGARLATPTTALADAGPPVLTDARPERPRGATPERRVGLAQASEPPKAAPAEGPAQPPAGLIPEPDRWRLLLPGAAIRPRTPVYDPYHPNILKGDYPIWGDKLFFSLTGVLDSFVDQKRNLDFTARIRDVPFHEENTLGQVTAILVLDLFHGDTVFTPRNWALRVAPVFRFRCNDENAQDHQCGSQATLFETFAEAKLFEVGPTFDATSARLGLQVFNADFFGFVYNDAQPGARVFSELARNQFKLNLAVFDRLNKDALTGLNEFDRREHQVGALTLEWDDFIWPGFNVLPGVVVARDGVLAGDPLEVYYVGLATTGHLGPLNVNSAVYYALGDTATNTPTGQRQDISAWMGFVQAAYPVAYWAPRLGLLYASGDRDPTDDRATGFDSVFDVVNFGGGQFSYVFGEKIQLGATTLWRGNSVFPSLRGANATSQFVNPGIFVVNPGLDVALTPKLVLEVNYNYLRFDDTASLERLSEGRRVSEEIGHELNAGFSYRPFTNEQVIVFLGGAVFFPGDAIRDLFGTTQTVYKALLRLVLTY